MNLLNFIRKEAKSSPNPLIIMAILGGLVNGALLGAFSSISSNDTSEPDLDAILLILSTMVIYYYTKKYTLLSSLTIMEEMINTIRKRIVGKLRHTGLASFERIDNSKVYSILTQEVNMLSQSVNAIVYAFQSSVIVLFCLVFIGLHSITALLTMLLAFLLGAMTYLKIQMEADAVLEEAMLNESVFFTALGQILDGFKEIKVHSKKNKAVFRAYAAVARNLKKLNFRAGELFSSNYVYTQAYFYILIGVVVFLLPSFSDINATTVSSVTIATLFMISPLMMTISAIPEVSRANIAIQNLYSMEKELSSIRKELNNGIQVADYSDFKKISFNKLAFTYEATSSQETPYSIGEIDLTINRGEILFIVGGNGSGKTTLLKLITGLYRANAGSISLDDRLLNATALHSYRELFTGIFADYHLFDKLYGVDEADTQRINELIVDMELETKTAFQDGRFTNLHLSQGQRKRLGMIVSLLEDKPIYIFDEWAADQDPHFKKYFYEELLQQLKAKDKTLIVISHDDRYFDFADRVVVMEYGKIIEEKFPKRKP